MLKHANRGALPAMLVLGVLIGASLAVVSPSRPARVVASATLPVTVPPGVPGDDEAAGSAGAVEPHARPAESGGDSSGTDTAVGGGGSGGTASAGSAGAGGTGSGGAEGSGSGGSAGGGSASTGSDGSGSTAGDGSDSTGGEKENNGKAKGHFDGKGNNG